MITAQEREERRALRAELLKLGINSSPNASVHTLRTKLAQAQSQSDPKVEESSTPKIEEPSSAAPSPTPLPSRESALEKAKKDALKLVRLRIQNVNPAKADLHGEIFTFANEVIGKVSKYVPYDEAGESYHVPNCIYKMLKNKKFLNVKTYTDKATGKIEINKSWVDEFALEELPPLTPQELKDLALKQKAQNIVE